MSIKGFKFDGVVHKYDYNSLDNIPDLNTETDKTLAIDGVPADAKATGDRISNLQSLVGSPLTASTAASMIDTNKVYVYTGSETGYTNGNWYYHDGTSWVSGGVYNSVAVDLDSTLTLANKAPDSKVVGDAIGSLNEDITNLTTATNGKAPSIYESASGSIASFSDVADDMPMKSCVVSIEPIQEGEGDPSPENVRPISGRTGLTVYRCGENLVNDSIMGLNPQSTILYIGATSQEYSYYLKSGTYTFSCDFAEGTHYGVYIKETNSEQIRLWATNPAQPTNQATFDLPIDGFYRMYFYRSSENGGVSVDGVSNIMLNYGETALPYEPYKQAENVHVNWESEAETVYGGTLDVVSGKLTITHKGIVLNGSEDWARVTGNYAHLRLKIKDGKHLVSNVGICDRFPRVTIASTTNYQGFNAYYSSGTDADYIGVRYDAAFPSGDIDSLKTWLSQNNTTVVYKLLEPEEIQLTPQEVRTLLGENNIWSDAGDMAVGYPADTKTYIDNKIAEAIAAALA